MKHKTMQRWRASIAGFAFTIASLVGAIAPTLNAHAATAATNVTATWNSTNRTVQVSWTGTGVSGDTYTVMVGSGGGMSWIAKDTSGANLTNLTATTVTSKNDTLYTDGSTQVFYITTKSTNNSTVDSTSYAQIVIGQTTGSSPNASAPGNLSTSVGGNGTAYVNWTAPLQSGTTPISAWSITVSLPDGSSPQTTTFGGPSDTTAPLTYSFISGSSYKVVVAAINGTAGVSPNSAQTTFTYALSGGGAGVVVLPTVTLPTNNSSYFTTSDLTVDAHGGLSSAFNGSNASNQNIVLGYVDGSTAIAHPVAQATFDLSSGSVDGSQMSYQTDLSQHKAFAHNVAQKAIGGTYTLFIPAKAGDKTVGICPGVSSLDAVVPSCANIYYLTDGGTNKAAGSTAKLVTIGGVQYWQVSGLTGTGGFSTASTPPNTGFGIVLASPLLVLGFGVAAAGALFLIGRKLARR